MAVAALFCFVNAESDGSSAEIHTGTAGDCGTNLSWSYDDSDDKLTISGTGATMSDFGEMDPAPWGAYLAGVKIIDMSGASNLTNIGEDAFIGSELLERVIFGPSITTVGNGAFFIRGSDNWKLYGLNGGIECSGSDLGGRTFVKNVYAKLWMIDPKVGDTVLINDFKATITKVGVYQCDVSIDGYGPGKTLSGTELYLPNNCVIWDGSGYNIPGMICSIGDGAFQDLTGLEKLDVACNITSIGAGAFKNCTNLSDLKVNINVDLSTGKPFEGCTNIEKITFAKGVGSTLGMGVNYSPRGAEGIPTYMDTPMYISKENLTEVVLGGSIKEVGRYMFAYCNALKSIDFPNTLNAIGNYAFVGCSGLNSVTIRGTDLQIRTAAFLGCNNLSELTMEEGVTEIGTLSFSKTGVTEVKIPDSVTSIGTSPFTRCDSLEAFSVNNTNTHFSVDEKGVLYTIDGKTVVAVPCKLSGKYVVPDGVTSLDSVFKGCNELSEIVLPSGLTSILTYAFFDCPSLHAITLPESLTTIGVNAFTYGFYVDGARVTAVEDLRGHSWIYDSETGGFIMAAAGSGGSEEGSGSGTGEGSGSGTGEGSGSGDSGDSDDNTMVYVAVGAVAAVVVLLLVLYFLHLGPFAKKD